VTNAEVIQVCAVGELLVTDGGVDGAK